MCAKCDRAIERTSTAMALPGGFVLRNKVISVAAAVLLMSVGGKEAQAAYTQGFETDTSGWTVSGSITQRASGYNSINASSGGNYAEITSLADEYDTGYGDAGYTFFGGRSGTYAGPFTQSLDIYMDTSWAAPTNPSVPAFWLDMSSVGSDGFSNFDTEQSFKFMVDGQSDIDVYGSGEASPFATINSSGWYTFQMTFGPGQNLGDPSQAVLKVLNASDVVIGTTTLPATANSALGSGGYAWLSVWQNGFAGDLLAIDNAASTAVIPEPTTLSLLGIGTAALLICRRRRRR